MYPKFRHLPKGVDLKYKSPLVNSVPWYNDRLYRGGHPTNAVLQYISWFSSGKKKKRMVLREGSILTGR